MVNLDEFLRNNYCLRIIINVFYGFYVKGGFQKANALAYTFLLSFAPFLISAASIITLFVPPKLFIRYQNRFLIESLPVIGKQIARYVQNFQIHALDLSIISLTFLFITTLLMINSLRYNLDQLLGFKKSDLSIGLKLIIILAVFTGLILSGVILLGVNEVISHYLPKYEFKNFRVKISVLQYITSVLAFSLIYKFVPHNKIEFKHAFIAGLIVAVLFEIAKFGFAIYIRLFMNDQNILYGSLAAIPIFLFWLYIVSIIFLLGAQIIAVLRHEANNGQLLKKQNKDRNKIKMVQIK